VQPPVRRHQMEGMMGSQHAMQRNIRYGLDGRRSIYNWQTQRFEMNPAPPAYMVAAFCCGGPMDYQRPDGYLAALIFHDVVPAYVDIGNYNYGVVLAADGYTLSEALSAAGAYQKYASSWVNVPNPTEWGISQRAFNNINQGWNDYVSGKWTEK